MCTSLRWWWCGQLKVVEKLRGGDVDRCSGVQTEVWCILICHPHLTSIIICRTAVWAQACGSEHKTSFFVIIVHLWFSRCPQSFVVAVGVFGGSSITILLFLVRIIWTFATVTSFVLCVLVNTLQYHDIVDIVQDSETEDPQLVAEPGVGRNHGKTMGKS